MIASKTQTNFVVAVLDERECEAGLALKFMNVTMKEIFKDFSSSDE